MGKKKSPFRHLVESEEGIRNFCSKYRIPSTVGMRYVAQGEWVDTRQTGEVIIPMIAFIEGGMTIPMGMAPYCRKPTRIRHAFRRTQRWHRTAKD